MPHRARMFGAVLLAVAALCGCTSMEQCLDLDDQSPGELHEVGAIIQTSNTELTVQPFQWIGGTWFSAGRVRTDDRRYAMGSGTELNLDNASIALAPSHVLKRLSFLFADKGGNENLRINSALANVAKLTSLDGALLGGVQVQIDWFTNGPIDFGQVFLVGPIVDFAIGGQELWIDDLCFWSTDVPVTPKTWARSYGGPSSDEGLSILGTSDGGAVVAGLGFFSNSGLWILKLDDAGAVEWQRTYGSTNWIYSFAQVLEASDGSLLVCHDKGSSTCVMRLSSLGASEWTNWYHFDDPSSPRSASLSADGSIFVAGLVGNSVPHSSDAFVTRLDPSGAMMWSKRCAADGSWGEWFDGITATGDGGCVAVGQGPQGRGWIVKLDALGNVEWQKSVTTPRMLLTSVLQTSDGGYLATGHHAGPPPVYADYDDALVMRLDASGSVSWQKSFGGSLMEDATSAVALADGSFTIAGHVNESPASLEFWMLQLDQDGDVVRQRTYGGPGGQICADIAVAAHGGYYLAGTTNFLGASNTADVWVCKVAADGSIAGPCPLSATTSRTSSDLVQPLAPVSLTLSNLTATVIATTITPSDTQATVVQQCPQP